MLYTCTSVTVISKFSTNFICFYISTIDSGLQDECSIRSAWQPCQLTNVLTPHIQAPD